MSAQLAYLGQVTAIERKSEEAVFTINDMIDAYLADRRSPHSKRPCKLPESLAAHFKMIREAFGDIPAKDFRKGSVQRVEQLVAAWREKGLKPGTCRKRISQLKTAFNFAVRKELLKRKHLPTIELPAGGAPRERFVDPVKELPALLDAADDPSTPDHIRLQTELLLRLGCRKGALLQLQWSKHIDFENRLVLLRETQSAEDRQHNKKRRENQPMDDELYEILTLAYENRTCDFVISWKGKQVKNTYHAQRKLHLRAGLTALHTHDLRRTSATYVYNEMGGDLDKAAAHIADSKAMAERTYIQKDANVKLPGLQAVGAVLRRARGEDGV